MSKRLQVILDDDDMKAIATLAREAEDDGIGSWSQGNPFGRRGPGILTLRGPENPGRAGGERSCFPDSRPRPEMLAEMKLESGTSGPLVTFIDSNIPMYLVSAEHPHKVDGGNGYRAADHKEMNGS
jgi:hypothetical protein